MKHFDANSLEGKWDKNGTFDPEHGEISRHTINVDISDYDLADTYFPAFRKTVEDGGALGVMCSYNSVNGTPACANSFLLKD